MLEAAGREALRGVHGQGRYLPERGQGHAPACTNGGHGPGRGLVARQRRSRYFRYECRRAGAPSGGDRR